MSEQPPLSDKVQAKIAELMREIMEHMGPGWRPAFLDDPDFIAHAEKRRRQMH